MRSIAKYVGLIIRFISEKVHDGTEITPAKQQINKKKTTHELNEQEL